VIGSSHEICCVVGAISRLEGSIAAQDSLGWNCTTRCEI
jgi:hypothetical protein